MPTTITDDNNQIFIFVQEGAEKSLSIAQSTTDKQLHSTILLILLPVNTATTRSYYADYGTFTLVYDWISMIYNNVAMDINKVL